MADDAKVEFYLKHRQIIEEWAAIGHAAAESLEHALIARTHTLDEAVPEARPYINAAGHSFVKLHLTDEPDVMAVELGWTRKDLLRGNGAWPTLRFVLESDRPRYFREAVKAATQAPCRAHGMGRATSGSWLWFGDVEPEQEPLEIEAYAETCLARLLAAYQDLQPVAQGIVTSPTTANPDHRSRTPQPHPRKR